MAASDPVDRYFLHRVECMVHTLADLEIQRAVLARYLRLWAANRGGVIFCGSALCLPLLETVQLWSSTIGWLPTSGRSRDYS